MNTIAPPQARMTDDQAKELARRLFYKLDKAAAEAHAEDIVTKANSFVAHRIIGDYMRLTMMSDEDIASFIKEELDLEESPQSAQGQGENRFWLSDAP